MAILNIDQFVERNNISTDKCEQCNGKLKEAPIKMKHLLKLVFSKKKIIKRYTCTNCRYELITEN